MAQFTMNTTIQVDGKIVREITSAFDVQSFLEYDREVGTTYVVLVDGDSQPTQYARVAITNTGSETALISATDNVADFDYTALPAGASMVCPLRTGTGVVQTYAARGESAATTLRIRALYI